MRIGLFTYGMADNLTGIGRYAMELSYGLRRFAPQSEIILLNPYPNSRLPWYRDFPCYSMPKLRKLPAVVTVGPALLARAARRLSLNVLHDPCGIGPFLIPDRRYAKVVTIHDAIPRLYPAFYPLTDRLLFRTFVPMCRWTADAVFTVSETSKADLRRMLKIPEKNIYITPNAVHHPADSKIAQWRERGNAESAYFLYVGAFGARKNVPVILKAFQSILRIYPRTRLVVVGPSHVPNSWTAFTSSIANLEFRGYVNDDDLHSLYANAQALLFPSIYEGFGVPALEAMAHGTPVIISATRALQEVCAHACIAVDASDEAQWAAAMAVILEDRDVRSYLAKEGRRRAKEYDWDKTASVASAAYQELQIR